MTSTQAALMLLLFCLPAAGLAVILWNGVHFAMEYYTRFKAYDAIILKASERNGVDPALLKAVIWQESKFDASTIGSKGEIGLMQIMQKFAAADWAKAHHALITANLQLFLQTANIIKKSISFTKTFGNERQCNAERLLPILPCVPAVAHTQLVGNTF